MASERHVMYYKSSYGVFGIRTKVVEIHITHTPHQYIPNHKEKKKINDVCIGGMQWSEPQFFDLNRAITL